VPYSGPREQEPHPGYAQAEYLLVPPLDPDRSSVAKWGYGLDPEPGTQPDNLTPPGADPEAAKTAEENQAYRDSLPIAEQQAYDVTLSGPADAESGGCVAAAGSQVPTVPSQPSANRTFTAAHEGLTMEMVKLTDWHVGMDPRALALDEESERCATGKGLDLSAVEYEWEGRLADQVPSLRNRPSPAAAMIIARELGEDGEKLLMDGDDLWETDLSAAPRLQAFPAQVQVALIDFDCREQVDYMDRMMAIVVDVEQEFLDANKDRLEALKADVTREG
jgi:hypothetical protein